MYWTFVTGAVKLRRRRLQLAFAAMAVVAALSTALFSVYSDVERKLSEQFQSYGANLVIASSGAGVTVPIETVDAARKLGAIAAPFLYSMDKLNGKPVVVTAVDLSRAHSLIQYWRIEGKLGPCMAGASLGLKPGDTAHLTDFSCVVTGVVSTGGSEDAQIIVPFPARSTASIVQVRARGDRLETIRQSLQRSFPDTDVRIVRAVAATETNVVLKMRTALFLLMAVILVITIMSVSGNFGELVMERSKEIGILKAIGAGERKIAALLLSESLVLAAFSTLIGYAVGVVLAGWIDRSVFSSAFAIRLNLSVLLWAGLVTLAVAGAATAIAAGRIWRIQPAAILRGE
jgi:putative ABC transport system permease protein